MIQGIGLLMVVALMTPALQSEEEVRRVIQKLRSERVEDRESAALALREMGVVAIPQLRLALEDSDPEVSGRAAYLLRAIPVSEALTDNIKRIFPGLVDRLSRGKEWTWTEVFLELSQSDRRGIPEISGVRKRDLGAIVLRALRGAVSVQEKEEALWRVGLWRLQEAAPGALAYFKDRDPGIRRSACFTLRVLDSREFLNDVAGLLNDPEEIVRTQAIGALGKWEASNFAPRVLAMLDQGTSKDRTMAAFALARMDVREALPGILNLLASEEPELREEAIGALGILGLVETAPRIASYLKDPSSSVRVQAARVLTGLQPRKGTDALLALLDDPDPEVCRAASAELRRSESRGAIPKLITLLSDTRDRVPYQAAWDLAFLDAKEAVPVLLRLLPDCKDRGTIAKSLAELEAKDAVPEIVALLRDPAPEVRCAAIQSLASLGVRNVGTLAVPLLQDEDPQVRICAAQWLCELGSFEGVPTLLDAGEELLWLNALRAPEAWKQLSETKVNRGLSGRLDEMLQPLVKAAGISLEATEHEEPWMNDWRSVGKLECRTALDALKAALCRKPGVILEEDRIRILPYDQLRQFWRDWWESVRRK